MLLAGTVTACASGAESTRPARRPTTAAASRAPR